MNVEVTASSYTDHGERKVREMVLYTVRSLVNHPADVEIVLTSDSASSVFYIHAHPEDLEELIGNLRQTAKALQIIVSASGMKLGRRLLVEVVEKASRTQ